jgi:hypothetical protein
MPLSGTRSLRLLVALAVLLSATLAGSFGGGDAGPEDAVRSYYGALAEGDGRAACRALSPDLRGEVERSRAAVSFGRRCEDLLALAPALNPHVDTGAIADLAVEVDEDGDRAVAKAENPLVRQPETLDLTRDGDEWRISSLQYGPRR